MSDPRCPDAIEPITVRIYYNDAGIRSSWLVGEWPAVSAFSYELLIDQATCGSPGEVGIGDLRWYGDIIVLDLLNASARYRITERDYPRDLAIAVLEAGEITAAEPPR